MPALSTYLRNSLRGWFLSTAFPADLATLYLALYTTATGPGAEGTEVTGGSYARIAIAVPADLATDGDGRWLNPAEIVSAVASADWGQVTHVALYDAATVGNRLAWAPLAAGRVVVIGQRLVFPAGSLVFDGSGM